MSAPMNAKEIAPLIRGPLKYSLRVAARYQKAHGGSQLTTGASWKKLIEMGVFECAGSPSGFGPNSALVIVTPLGLAVAKELEART